MGEKLVQLPSKDIFTHRIKQGEEENNIALH